MQNKEENRIHSADSAQVCQNCKKDFVIEPDDFGFYEKIGVPPPTFCSECRAIRRMAFRNMDHLFARTCDATGDKIFSFVPREADFKVYGNNYWNSDKWNPLEYGRDYDYSKPFFDQFRDLYQKVPWGIMWTMEMINCSYSVSAFSRNCYLCFDSAYDEDSAYNVTLLYSKQCFDCLNVKDCELCYYCLNTNQSYKTFFSRDCTSCVDVWFSQDCVGCNDCFGCSGLRNKSYCIFNIEYDKVTYKRKLAEMKLYTSTGLEKARKQSLDFWEKSPVKYRHSIQVTDSQGDYIYNGKELKNCFFVGNAQNMKYCQSVIYPPNNDGMDITSSEGTELSYEILACGRGAHRNVAVVETANSNDSYYCVNCRNISNCFGCVALRSKSYCIFNKQFTKTEYFKIVKKIKKHMNDMPYVDKLGRVYKFGEFFPVDMAAHGYAQSQAFEYFPKTKDEAQKEGYNWYDNKERNYNITIKSRDLPDSIENVSDEILKEIIQCQHEENCSHSRGCEIDCATAFRITKQELDFYRTMRLPLPRLCFNCRHIDRIKWRNAPLLFHRTCLKEECTNEFETSYAPDRPEQVYCEACYQKEVY